MGAVGTYVVNMHTIHLPRFLRCVRGGCMMDMVITWYRNLRPFVAKNYIFSNKNFQIWQY